MVITYRRTVGIFAFLTLAAVGFAAAALTVAVAAAVLFVAFVVAAASRLTRAVLPVSWWRRAVPPATPWPHETIEATVVKSTGSSNEGDLLRLDSDQV